MRVIVVGLGVQGQQAPALRGRRLRRHRRSVRNPEADFRAMCARCRSTHYDAALVCIPDAAEDRDCSAISSTHGKHVLVEKPLVAERRGGARPAAAGRARQAASCCYTAYNHRFEPHFVRMRDLVESGELGRIYRCRMFYGNGTARLVRNSAWRDHGAGVLADLGSHLLDTARFWFGDIGERFSHRLGRPLREPRPDHVVFAAPGARPQLELEMTLLTLAQPFHLRRVRRERHRAHQSLCKWGPSTFTHRTRMLPSGRPPEQSVTLVQDDPTWALEYEHFKALCRAAADRSRERPLAQSRAAQARRRDGTRWRARHDSPSSAMPG